MKKIAFLMFGILASASLFAVEANQFVVSVSSEGPDAYADGVVVAPGTAAYRVVFVNEGATFAGFLPDGTLVDSKNNQILSFPAKALTANAKSGLDLLTFQYAADSAYANGEFKLAFLDTRGPAGASVLGYSLKGVKVSAADRKPKTVAVTEPQAATLDTVLPEGVTAPTITKVNAETVWVDNLVKGVPYAVQTTPSLENPEWKTAPVSSWVAAPATSAAVPVTDGDTQFIRIKVKPSTSEIK